MKSKCIVLTRAGWLVSVSVVLSLAACHREQPSPASASNSQQAESIPVRYIAASEQPIEDRLELSAKVQADPSRSFRVFPPASGRVLGIQVKPGDTVTRGETLATIDSADAASAQSDLTKAEIEAERAQRAADREKVLLDHGAIAEKDYIDAKAAADSAQAELARARRHLEVLGMSTGAKTDRIPLLSPSRGVVLSVSAAPGEFSKSLDNADPLMTIADLSIVWIVGDVFEKDIAKVQPGTKVRITVDAFPGQQWTGRIDSVSGALDPTTRTLKVRASLVNPGEKLKPEMYAAIHVDVGRHTALVVPTSAVIHEGQNTVVFVDNDGKPEQRNVTTGQAIDGRIEIISGLRAGQQVAVNGAELLTGGSSQP
jgi:cobalt-zinc-cadmium efflux system membrane fusion protein